MGLIIFLQKEQTMATKSTKRSADGKKSVKHLSKTDMRGAKGGGTGSAGTGKVSTSDLTITKTVDVSSPKLF